MIAHKMVAFTERPSIANRDLFDIHFLLQTEAAATINYKVIETRTGKNPREFYTYLLNLIEKINPKNILDGLGEVKGLIQRQIDLVLD